MRYYPTDLLLAVEDAERALAEPESGLARLLREAGLSALAGLFAGAAVTEGLDRLLGGLGQFPWQPAVDSDDVYLISPAGVVVLDDHRPGNTLRGLLLAWAVGNEVVVRTVRESFWTALAGRLRAFGHPLPPLRATAPDAPVPAGARPVAVPDVVPVLRTGTPDTRPEAALGLAALDPAPFDPAVFAEPVSGSPSGDTEDILIVLGAREAADPAGLVGDVPGEDCRAPWPHRLLRREHLRGTTLSAARSADRAREADRVGARLRYLVGQARRTPFYRDLPAVTGLDDLGRLPVLEKAALEANSLPGSRGMSTDRPRTGEVLRSGASTGAPRYIVYSRTDWENMIREAIPLFRTLGLENGDRLINTLYGGGLYGGLSTTLCELSRMPLECYSTAQAISVDDLLMLCESFEANALLGLPVLIMPLLREAKQRRPGLRLEKVVYGGTPMTETDKDWLREELGARVVTSILAANDGAQLGYQCARMGGTLHHACPDYNLIEVVDENLVPVPEGEPGELLITSLQKFEGPLIRYRIGDLGRVFQYDCPCGVSGPVLEYLGRADGQVKVKGATVTHAEMLAALEVFRVSQLQVEIVSVDGRETVIARVESPLALDAGEVRDHLARQFKTLDQEHLFNDALDVFELVVECHPEGGLTRNATSGKIKPVIDRRLVDA
ncbi:phenylacetate--CoA ligase family protein [Streptomyces sp. Go-475]|uniref:phenylacetate--CoA ligase family protein n=1 Tax=Streptomyces sp. Go-475 TaxID=2072505 RepID=UPI000DEFC679|nr:phenylacetate--CoA ligase family protein [Streptomyces sp. Go-475]AXE88800.1 Phenylacetate-coenzyme A ligase [Streptomyces sp. Go-475]